MMNNPETALKEQAVALVVQGRYTEARDLYKQICSSDVADADAWFKLGAVSGMLGDLEGVVRASKQAIKLAPQFASAYENLGEALQRQGKVTESVVCYQSMASIMRDAGKFPEAQRALDLLLALSVTHSKEMLAQIYFNRGSCRALQGHLAGAVEDFKTAIEIQPDESDYHFRLGDTLFGLNCFSEAYDAYIKASQGKSDNAEAYARLAVVCERMHKTKEARKFAEKALEQEPDNLTAIVALAALDRRAGDFHVALERLKTASNGCVNPEDECDLNYELGRVNDRLGYHAEALHSFRLANIGASRMPAAQSCSVASRRYLQSLVEFRSGFTAQRLGQWRNEEPQGAANVHAFLVGHPRSGTTLMEQLLSAIPNTVVSGETPMFDEVVLALMNKAGSMGQIPEYLDTISSKELTMLREIYWEQVQQWLDPDARKKNLIDKYPLNLNYIGIIQRVFPGSKIIVALRDPRDVCVSCFMQNFVFNPANVNFLDMESTTRHYVLSMGLWLHYRSVINLRWFELRYEDLVTDFESSARCLVSFLGLEWDDAVLSFFGKKRQVSTPSYQDVMSPIFSRAIGRWKDYRTELAPGLSELEPFVKEFGYEK